jgi:hypothetical protein
LIPLLTLILKQEYSPRALNWFYVTTNNFLGGYEYDTDMLKVIMNGEDINANVDKTGSKTQVTSIMEN